MSLRKVIKRIQPDLIHAGPIQTCAFIAVLTGFRPILTMSWGFDLMKDDTRNRWWQWVTRYTLRRSTYFTSDAHVTRDKAVAYGMNPDRTVVFPWGVDLSHFTPKDRSLNADSSFTLFCNRSWEPNYGVDVVARAFVKVAQQREDISLMLAGWRIAGCTHPRHPAQRRRDGPGHISWFHQQQRPAALLPHGGPVHLRFACGWVVCIPDGGACLWSAMRCV